MVVGIGVVGEGAVAGGGAAGGVNREQERGGAEEGRGGGRIWHTMGPIGGAGGGGAGGRAAGGVRGAGECARGYEGSGGWEGHMERRVLDAREQVCKGYVYNAYSM